MILATMAAAALMTQAGEAHPPHRARANLNQYFTTDDYPMAALRRRAEGTTMFRLEIDATGKVTSCVVTWSSGDRDLDNTTCNVMLTRAHYQPARDARGRAVADWDVGRVTWRLPPVTHGLTPLVLTRTESRLHASGNGLLTCTVLIDGTPVPDIGTSQCGPLAGSGADFALRSAPSPGDVVIVWVVGPADADVETPLPGEAELGMRAFNLTAALEIGEDGRIATCRSTSRELLPTLTFGRSVDICAFYPPGRPPVFAPATGPRPAKMRMTLYLDGWAVQAMTRSPPRP